MSSWFWWQPIGAERSHSRCALSGKQGVCIYKRSKRTSSVAAGNPFLLVGKHPKPFEQTVPLVWLRGNPAAFRLPTSVDFPLPAPPQTPPNVQLIVNSIQSGEINQSIADGTADLDINCEKDSYPDSIIPSIIKING